MTDIETCEVGDRIPELARDIDLATLVRYAGASGDFNPIHYDDTYALAAGLDGVIGHGMLAMGLASLAVTNWIEGWGVVRDFSVRFQLSYRLGDRLTVSGEVVETRIDEEGRSVVALRLSCTNPAGEDVLGNATATVVSR